MHTMVIGPTGAGKNTTVIDPLRYSAIADPAQTVISFSLKAGDYGPIKSLCKKFKKRLVVINLNDAQRSLSWNPLDVDSLDEAIDVIDVIRIRSKIRIRTTPNFGRNGSEPVSLVRASWLPILPRIVSVLCTPNDELIRALKTHTIQALSSLRPFWRAGLITRKPCWHRSSALWLVSYPIRL